MSWVLVTIQRTMRADTGTQGVAMVAGFKERFDTLEPRDAIPAGIYEAYLHRVPVLGVDHPQYRRIYELQRVPDRRHVEIDRGHFAGDVKLGLANDLAGAIALGFAFGEPSPGLRSAKPPYRQPSRRELANV